MNLIPGGNPNMTELTDIEAARAELYEIANRHNLDFQHEDVIAASQRLDVLIAKDQLERSVPDPRTFV
jgi:hypothetical protein